MILKVKNIFPNSSLGGNFYIYELPEGPVMRKILAHGYQDTRIQKNVQAREEIFWIFTYFCGVMRVQSPACTPAHTEILSTMWLNLKFFIYNSWKFHVFDPRLIFFWNSPIPKETVTQPYTAHAHKLQLCYEKNIYS